MKKSDHEQGYHCNRGRGGEMKPNTFIKPSFIHGLGLFAKTDIRKGESIKQGLSNFNDYLEEWITYVKTWKIRSFAHNNGYCMINHNEVPNTKRMHEMEIVATSDIKKGAEITEDYSKLPDQENPFMGMGIEEMIYRAKNDQVPIELR